MEGKSMSREEMIVLMNDEFVLQTSKTKNQIMSNRKITATAEQYAASQVAQFRAKVIDIVFRQGLQDGPAMRKLETLLYETNPR